MQDFEKDITNLSSRLRLKALQIISKLKRPMAVQEIQNYIRDNERELWQEMQSKCSDYVRIILSLTKNKLITKYKPVVPVPGIDKRSTFYGLSSERYPVESWVKLAAKAEKQIIIDEKQDSGIFENFADIFNPSDEDERKYVETK